MAKLKKRTVYVSDRDQPFYVEDMTPSHLLNAIKHHKEQIETLEWIKENYEHSEYVLDRTKALLETVDVLVSELNTRNPEDDTEGGDNEE